MGHSDDLNAQVGKILQEQWTTRDGNVVPEPKDLRFANDGVHLNATCLYADLADSTKLVDGAKDVVAAEVFKCFLYCAAKTIHLQGGRVTAYDGDRVMAVFISDRKNTEAVRSALAISYAVEKVIKPALQRQYPNGLGGYSINYGVGIDTGKVLVARAGFRNADDLVWIGPAANYAAKLSALRTDGYNLWITKAVHDSMHSDVKIASDGKSMWEERTWTDQGGRSIFRSNYTWGL